MTQLQESVLALVGDHTKEDPITGRDIANRVGMRPRDSGKEGADLRSVISALRQKGQPICASKGGYYYARDRYELADFIDSLGGRVEKLNQVIYGLNIALNEWNVVELEDEEEQTTELF